MADEKTPWEKLQAIWNDVCVAEGFIISPEQTEDDIRHKFGDQAARSFKFATQMRQTYIDKIQSVEPAPKIVH